MSRVVIEVAGGRTWAHICALSDQEAELFAPATHSCVCMPISDIAENQSVTAGDTSYRIVKVWDDAQTRLARSRTRDERDFHRNRAGKFINMHLVEI